MSISLIGVVEIEDGQKNMEDLCTFPVRVIDASGVVVEIDKEPQRIITLAPSAAQTMWEIGGKDKVVGVTYYARYLKGVDEKNVISNSGGEIILESVVSLDPDLVLAPSIIPEKTVGKLREAGVTVYYSSELKTIEDIMEETRLIGRLSGECEGAEEVVGWMLSSLDLIYEETKEKEPPTVLYVFYGWTAGGETLIDEVIERAGGKNSAKLMGISGYRQLNAELIIQNEPEWIIINSDEVAEIENNEIVQNSNAGQKGQIIIVDVEHLNQPAPGIILAIEKIAYEISQGSKVEESGNVLSEKNSEESENSAIRNDSNRGYFEVVGLIILIVVVIVLAKRE